LPTACLSQRIGDIDIVVLEQLVGSDTHFRIEGIDITSDK
jgi:hypothetical protein